MKYIETPTVMWVLLGEVIRGAVDMYYISCAHTISAVDSSFNLCYDPTTNVITKGVWTGSLTNVTAPDDYIEPTKCTASEFSECST